MHTDVHMITLLNIINNHQVKWEERELVVVVTVSRLILAKNQEN